MMLSRRLFQQEFEVRGALKTIRVEAKAKLPRQDHRGIAVTFSVKGLKDRRANAIALVQEQGADTSAFEQCLHRDADSLDNYRRSAACPYEQFRTRVWATVTLPQLFPDSEPLHWVTIAHPAHRVTAAGLGTFDPKKVKRIVQTVRSAINAPSKVFGMVEVSVSKNRGVSIFEPHVHFIVSGPTRDQLEQARSKFPKSSMKIDGVTTVPGLLLYLTKFAADERVAYLGELGDSRRRDNGMKPPDKSAWLSWMAGYGIADLMVEGGFQPNLKSMFRSADTGDLVDRLVRPETPNRPKTLSIRQLRP